MILKRDRSLLTTTFAVRALYVLMEVQPQEEAGKQRSTAFSNMGMLRLLQDVFLCREAFNISTIPAS